jgi:DNA polymerase-3 subunit epsilon
MRLAVPDGPGVYRMLRVNGDVLYVGKASSLRHRVNSYFRKQHGVHERTLEMLSQARGLSFETAPTALEAALLEADEIKRLRPAYNVALARDDRSVWFASPDLGRRSPHVSSSHPLGPFPSEDLLDQFAALARGDRSALAHRRWGPAPSVVGAALDRLRAAHPWVARRDVAAHVRWLRLGTRLWRDQRRAGHRDPPARDRASGKSAWTPESTQASLELIAVQMVTALRRARWLTQLAEAAVVWSEPDAAGVRLIVIEHGEIVAREAARGDASPPVPPGHDRPPTARLEAFTVARLDRLRVLTTEIKRLVAQNARVLVRFGPPPPLAGAPLARLVWRV